MGTAGGVTDHSGTTTQTVARLRHRVCALFLLPLRVPRAQLCAETARSCQGTRGGGLPRPWFPSMGADCAARPGPLQQARSSGWTRPSGTVSLPALRPRLALVQGWREVRVQAQQGSRPKRPPPITGRGLASSCPRLPSSQEAAAAQPTLAGSGSMQVCTFW